MAQDSRCRDHQAGEGARAAYASQAGRPDRSTARERPFGCQVLDAGHDGHGAQPRAQRQEREGPGSSHQQRSLRLRLLPALHLDVWPHRARDCCRPFRASARGGQAPSRHEERCRHCGHRPEGALRGLQGSCARRHRQGVPAGSSEAVAWRGRGRVPLVERATCHRLPQPREDQPRTGHGGERSGHGLRQS